MKNHQKSDSPCLQAGWLASLPPPPFPALFHFTGQRERPGFQDGLRFGGLQGWRVLAANTCGYLNDVHSAEMAKKMTLFVN